MASAYTFNIFVVNNDPTCDSTTIQSQVTLTACSETYLVKIGSHSDAQGPFNVYTGTTSGTPVFSALTRAQIISGVTFVMNNNDPSCFVTPTPTQTETPTQTPTVTPGLSPTQSVTPTQTPTPTVTPTVTITPNLSHTPTPSITATPTVTPTLTPTPTVPTKYAYLFIEPQTGATNIGQYLYDLDNNRTFFGFTNSSVPDTADANQFDIDMNEYVSFSGWTGGTFPAVQSSIVPQISGGVDDYGNAISAYNFKTHKVSAGSVGSPGWYIWIIPTGATNGGQQTQIDYNGNANALTTVYTDSTIRANTFTYTGSTIPAGTYRVYTTFADLAFYINDNDNIYFKGNTVV